MMEVVCGAVETLNNRNVGTDHYKEAVFLSEANM